MSKSAPLFEKVLIANRGEIALRVMRTLKRMGIKSVAVYSEADTNSLHVQFADEAYYVGHSSASESYLNIEHIIDAVHKSGAKAVHPGYGFLSENAKFARALRDERITLIGPSVEAIASMGDKIEAKKIAEKAGVSTIPGFMDVIGNAEHAVEIASNIGFPVMLKAAAGGGGRGMRIVRNHQEAMDAFVSASREAKSSFSDERVFIEKFIENPRHIEIQLLADTYGNALCLGERECSIQRHHQKLIEEAPSVFIDETIRQKMYDQVISLAKVSNYYSAGTVEFIMDQNKNFYFLEMNTRLQVEHCVTELITGIDIVEMMIRIAAGEKLSMKQEDVKLNGWAIESRICSEDPSRGFLPSSGRITEYQVPKASQNIRIDSGVFEGGDVSMFYDSMIAKLCSYAPTREEAIQNMLKGLSEYVIRGIAHNMSFLEAIISHKRFQEGNITTNFIDEEYPDGFLGAELTSETTRNFLAVAVHIYMKELYRTISITGQMPGRAYPVNTRWVINIDSSLYPVNIRPVLDGYNIKLDKDRIYVRSTWVLGNSLFRGTVNGKEVIVKIDGVIPGGYVMTHAGRTVNVTIRTPRMAELERYMPVVDKGAKSQSVEAPLAGKIITIKVEKGQNVKEGEELCIIEAMKMENIICSEREGVIETIHVKDGDNINAGDVILEFA